MDNAAFPALPCSRLAWLSLVPAVDHLQALRDLWTDSIVWLSEGTVAGYRELDTGVDHPASELQAEQLVGVLAEWLRVHGLTCARLSCGTCVAAGSLVGWRPAWMVGRA